MAQAFKNKHCLSKDVLPRESHRNGEPAELHAASMVNTTGSDRGNMHCLQCNRSRQALSIPVLVSMYRKRLDQSKSPRVRLQRLEKCIGQYVCVDVHMVLLQMDYLYARQNRMVLTATLGPERHRQIWPMSPDVYQCTVPESHARSAHAVSCAC